MPQEFTPRKRPPPKTYQNSSRRKQGPKRFDKAVVSEKVSSDVSDLSPSEADEPMDDVPKVASRSTKRQLSKTTVREPTKLSTRTKRTSAPAQSKAKAASSANGSEGSDLTDIGEENAGGKEADAPGNDQGKLLSLIAKVKFPIALSE